MAIEPQSRSRRSSAQHQAWSDFPADTVVMLVIPGIPADGSLILAGAEQAEVPLPMFSPAQVSRTFFQRQRTTWLTRTLHRIGRPELHDRYWFPPMNDGVAVWTLGDVERMIRFLSREGAIDYDRLVISLQLVLWTAKGYGLYV